MSAVAPFRLLLPVAVFVSAAPAPALEKCVSPAGKITYSEHPCPAGSKASTVRGTAAPPPATSPARPAAAGAARGSEAKKAPPATGMDGRGDVGQVEIRYYDVQGGDYETLLAGLKKHGPRGLAEWSLAYEYQPRRAGKACSVAALTTTLKQAMTLPRWSPPRGASPQLIADWARYVAGQRKHQEGHLAIGRAMQAAFRESLAVTQVRCERLEAAIKEQYKLLLERYQARENAYDFDTAFGRTEGAEFARR